MVKMTSVPASSPDLDAVKETIPLRQYGAALDNLDWSREVGWMLRDGSMGSIAKLRVQDVINTYIHRSLETIGVVYANSKKDWGHLSISRTPPTRGDVEIDYDDPCWVIEISLSEWPLCHYVAGVDWHDQEWEYKAPLSRAAEAFVSHQEWYRMVYEER